MTYRLLVTGSRTWENRALVYGLLDLAFARFGFDLVVVHGDCPRGADAIAEQWCRDHIVISERHPADWEHLGRRAGLVRNAEMVATKPDMVLAFIKNESAGATHCTGLARKAGLDVRLYTE